MTCHFKTPYCHEEITVVDKRDPAYRGLVKEYTGIFAVRSMKTYTMVFKFIIRSSDSY